MNLAICGILFRRVAAVCVRHPGIVRIDAKNELRGWAVWLTIFWLVAAGQSAWAQASMTLNISPAHPTDTDSRTLAQSETASLTINVAAKGMANGVNYILKSGPDFTLDLTSPEFVWTGARGSYWIVNTSPQSAVASVTARCVWTPAPPSGGGLAKGGYSPPLPPDIEGLAVGTAFALPGGEYWNEADTNILCVYETTLVRAYENDEPAESDWSIGGPGEILGATNGVDTVVVKGTEASTSMWDLVVTSVSCASGASDTEYLTVVGVKGLEYWRVKERVWAELPEPLCVGLGAIVYFRALKQPAVAPWPAGKPVWEGAIGSGERASRTVTNAGMHYVYAECGNTVTGAIYVVSNYTIIASSVYIGLSNTVTASAWTVDAHGAAVKTNSNWSIPEGYAQAKFMVESELLTKAVDVDTVTLLGLAASATLGDIRVHACAVGDSEICDDEWFTVIEADLDADINMDCGIDASDDPDEDAAEKPGLLVGVNNNTHALEDWLTEADYADDIINGEEDRNDDLKVLKLALHPAMTNGNLVLRCAGNSSVRIFDETDTAVIGPGLGMEHTIPASNVPPAGLEYRIEALEGGREVTVELEYQLPGGGAVCDKVKVSTVNMTGVDGYCFGSLNKTKVVAIPDSAGRATDKCYAIPDKLGPENPAEVLVRLEPAEGKEITWLTYGLLGLPYDGQPGGGIGVYDEMSRQWVAPLGIRDAATGAGAVPLYYALTYDEVFWQIVVWLQDLWDNEDPWAHTMFNQRPTASDVYNYVLAYLNIAPGDVWYYWQMPTITTTGDKLFNIVNYDPVSIISDIKFTVIKVDMDIRETAQPQNRVGRDDPRPGLPAHGRNRILVWANSGANTITFDLIKPPDITSPAWIQIADLTGLNSGMPHFERLDAASKTFTYTVADDNDDVDLLVRYGADLNGDGTLAGTDEIKGTYEVYGVTAEDYAESKNNYWFYLFTLTKMADQLHKHFAYGAFEIPGDYAPTNISGSATLNANRFTHDFGATFSDAGFVDVGGRKYYDATATVPIYHYADNSPGSELIRESTGLKDGLDAFVAGLSPATVAAAYAAAPGGATRSVNFSLAGASFDFGRMGGIGLGGVGVNSAPYSSAGSIALQVTQNGSNYDIGSDATIDLTLQDLFDFDYFTTGWVNTRSDSSRSAAMIQNGFGKTGSVTNAGQVGIVEVEVDGSVTITGRTVTP